MKMIYPTPLDKSGTLDYIHSLESRLAHRTRGSNRFMRRVRCQTRLLTVRLLDKLERLLV